MLTRVDIRFDWTNQQEHTRPDLTLALHQNDAAPTYPNDTVTATEDWEQINQHPPAAATEDWEQLNQHPPAALNRGYATPHRTTREKLQQSNISWLTKEPLAQYAMQM
ncbi:hypothetical protein F511_40544 [Dorcoceras hygrometricum]|uniref:Uncharacterized protein n=1 Tax=Dorcoceras hygrometricum TaxID=472368 RepID=A0A2Z7BIT4_9LAMI|nr:hypothetical protein F511_40544 [Dorcoceras hygrometricum]